VDAVCKTKENISARLSLRFNRRLRCAPRYLSAQLCPFSSAIPPKKTNNYSNSKKRKQITPYVLPPKKSSKTTTEKAAQRGIFFL
jgi:hypothetical protein